MNIELLKNILAFLVLLLVQALVLNHIHLFGCATPLIYLYMVLSFRRDYARWAILLWCFVMGLAVDVFSNTPGVAAGAMTLMGFLQPYILAMFIQRDSPDDLKPSMRTLGIFRFISYSLIIVIVYCLVFFTLESFNFFNWVQWLECVSGSSLLTLILIWVVENFKTK
jgi:rod shape-determining protein MreD